jgi:uncharacterized protein YprB with RNaseH-like and TPR domain
LPSCKEAYLDIETTGLSPIGCDITVVGIHLCNGDTAECVQLVGRDVTSYGILEVLEGVDIIYTYNGSRFDLPFINARLGIDLEEMFVHRDLMYDCWRYNLKGGLKAVERQLGINRDVRGVDGFEAVRLWWRYVDTFDLEALDTLLAYNKEDVVNLKTLKEMLL